MSTGTITLNPPSHGFNSPQAPTKIALAWVSDAAGAVSQATTYGIKGLIVRVAFIPSATVAPTDLYDVTLTDGSGIDVLYGAGANLSATVASDAIPTVGSTGLPPTVSEVLTLVVANAGVSKGGTVVLYVRP